VSMSRSWTGTLPTTPMMPHINRSPFVEPRNAG